MPDTGDVRAAERRPRFPVFQQRLEAVHDWVHSAVGGNMVTSRSPADPLFWLHHANIDRIWARWQDKPQNERPANGPEDLQPRATMSSTVTQSLRIDRLGYRYS
jgi:tyrosinase